jgi:hypothetical protein
MIAYFASFLRSAAAAICSSNGKYSPFNDRRDLRGLHSVQLRHHPRKGPQ